MGASPHAPGIYRINDKNMGEEQEQAGSKMIPLPHKISTGGGGAR